MLVCCVCLLLLRVGVVLSGQLCNKPQVCYQISALLSVLREWLLLGCCLILWCHWGSEEGLSWLHVSEELWASYAQLAMRWVGMALRACACSRQGGARCAWLFRFQLQLCTQVQIVGSAWAAARCMSPARWAWAPRAVATCAPRTVFTAVHAEILNMCAHLHATEEVLLTTSSEEV